MASSCSATSAGNSACRLVAWAMSQPWTRCLSDPNVQQRGPRGGSDRGLVDPIRHPGLGEGRHELHRAGAVGGRRIVAEVVGGSVGYVLVAENGDEDQISGDEVIDQLADCPRGARRRGRPLIGPNSVDQVSGDCHHPSELVDLR